MEEESIHPQTSNIRPIPRYPRSRFNALLVVMVLLIVFIAVVQFLEPPTVDAPAVSQSAIQGNIYAYQWKMSFGPFEGYVTQTMPQIRETSRQSAVTLYQLAFRQDRSIENLRRLIILQYPEERENEIERLEEIAASPELPEARREDLHAEIAMWREIYVDVAPVDADTVDLHVARIQDLNLEWYEHLALADLYENAGMTEVAETEQAQATRIASRRVAWLAGLMITMGLLGLLGIALIIWYIGAKRSRRLGSPDITSEIPPETREALSGYLLEVFVVYLAVVIGVQLGAGVILAAFAIAGGETMLTESVFFIPAVYLVAGLVALAYLAHRLSSLGWSWRTVGLTSREPFKDIVWGIGGYAAALPLLVVAGVISQVIARYVHAPTHPVLPLFAEADTILELGILFVFMVGAAAFFEEIFFRGVLFNSFRAKWSVSAGIVLSAVVFASVHQLPTGFLPIFVLGSVFSILLYERRSVLPAVVAHGLNNGVAFMTMLIMTGI